MIQSNPEPIEKKDIEIEKIIPEEKVEAEKNIPDKPAPKEILPMPEISPEKGAEIGAESQEEKVSEKMETARKTIGTQAAAQANVSDDAQSVSDILEFEKKVEKLVEIAVQKGPEHAIQVAQHMDKSKDPAQADNYTLDEIHDRLMEDELRKQMIEKGLLKDL